MIDAYFTGTSASLQEVPEQSCEIAYVTPGIVIGSPNCARLLHPVDKDGGFLFEDRATVEFESAPEGVPQVFIPEEISDYGRLVHAVKHESCGVYLIEGLRHAASVDTYRVHDSNGTLAFSHLLSGVRDR
jgi:hypothetical protein